MDVSVQFLILIPVILGVTQVIKKTGLASKWAPLCALILGVAGAFLLGGISGANVVQGLIAGLTACGLWSGTKATLA